MIACPRLGDVLLGLLCLILAQALLADLGADEIEDLADLDVVVPRIERAHPRRPAHDQAVLGDARDDDCAAVGRVEPSLAPEDLEARREPFHVPFPRTGERLVEVVDVEQHLPLWRGEHAEVRQVRVAAQLDVDAGQGSVREVGRHDQRTAAKEREGTVEHAAMPDRHERRHARLGLLLEERDRVGPRRRRRPPPVGRSRRSGSRRAPPRDPLFHAEVLVPSCSGGSHVSEVNQSRAARRDAAATVTESTPRFSQQAEGVSRGGGERESKWWTSASAAGEHRPVPGVALGDRARDRLRGHARHPSAVSPRRAPHRPFVAGSARSLRCTRRRRSMSNACRQGG